MSKDWQLQAESQLLQGETPAVLTSGMLQMIAAGRGHAPSRAAFQRWQDGMVRAGKLRRVIRGVYLNRMGHHDASPAAAAHWVRSRSVVSLAWVLEQAGVTNNFGDTVTCVIPIDPSWPNPQISDRKTDAGTFRFFAMPAHLVDERSGAWEDIRDARFDYPRTTPEKALVDWIYLGASPRSRLTPPPVDLDIQLLRKSRLRRIAARMGLRRQLDDWLAARERYLADPDVRDNLGSLLRL
jgi:hypothetical protein